jgi:hypothetical protein
LEELCSLSKEPVTVGCHAKKTEKVFLRNLKMGWVLPIENWGRIVGGKLLLWKLELTEPT